MSVTKYDKREVDAVLDAHGKGISSTKMIDEGMTSLSAVAIMAIIRDVNMHGYENIIADGSVLDDDDGDEIEQVAADPFKPVRPRDFGEPESEGVGIPDVAAKQAEQVASTVRDRNKPLPRGKKPPNVKDNIAMNAQRRRRRGGNPQDMRRRLLADEKALHPDFEYRWVLDRPGRIAEKTKFDDWDIVTDAHVMEGMGGNVQAIAGTNHYNADKMILLRKPKEFFQHDAREKLKEVSTLEDQIRQGSTAASSGQHSVDTLGPKEVMERLKSDGVDRSNTYVPVGEKITIGQVSETP